MEFEEEREAIRNFLNWFSGYLKSMSGENIEKKFNQIRKINDFLNEANSVNDFKNIEEKIKCLSKKGYETFKKKFKARGN